MTLKAKDAAERIVSAQTAGSYVVTTRMADNRALLQYEVKRSYYGVRRYSTNTDSNHLIDRRSRELESL